MCAAANMSICSAPVLINSWEAAYFDFTGDTIVDLAKEAASLGIDMVVMDDGWFGKRNDDNSSLGDWQVNEKKLGGSLAELITRVHNQGVKFGIWIEPEMVNEDSDLYRAHPDWAIQIPGKKPGCARETSYCLIFPEKKCATVYLIRFVPCWIREKLIMSSGI